MAAAPLVTVIMPAYNARAYIEHSVSSVLEQTFRDLVLWVVNDGSTDDTAEILQYLASKDDRLKVLTVPNGGPAKARNIALDQADPGTQFFMFLDADDVLLPGAIQYALTGAGGEDATFVTETGTGQPADLTLFGFSIVSVDGTQRDYFEPAQSLTRDDLGPHLARLYKANLLNQVWGKLLHADLIQAHSIRFQDCRWGEDRLFLFDCLDHAQTIEVLPACQYHYLMHPGESLITRFYDQKFAICCQIDQRMEALCQDLGVTDQAAFRYMFVKSVYSCLTTLFARSCPLTRQEKRAYIQEIITNPQVQRRCRDASGGRTIQMLCRALQSGSVSRVYRTARSMALAGRLLPGLFLRIKHRK